MRTQNYSQILFDALQYSGNDRQNIQADTFAQFRDFSNARMREAWEASEWTDIVRIAKNAITIDALGVASFVPIVTAGEILAVFTRNPQETTKAVQIQYQLYDLGTSRKVIVNTALTEVWYVYRLICPILTGELYSPNVVYFKDVQIYFDAGSGTGSYTPVLGKPYAGNFYTCTASSTIAGQNPNTNASSWTKIDIPYIFSSFMSWASAANWFVSEGQMAEAATIEAKANQILDMEYDKMLRQQSQFGRINMTNTY